MLEKYKRFSQVKGIGDINDPEKKKDFWQIAQMASAIASGFQYTDIINPDYHEALAQYSVNIANEILKELEKKMY